MDIYTFTVEALLAESNGLREKLSKAKLYRHLYESGRALFKKEQELLKVERAWTQKLERVIANIRDDVEGDAFDFRKYCEKVLESKPKGLGG